MKEQAFVDAVLCGSSTRNQKVEGFAFAPSNIALCKYWGKTRCSFECR